MQTYAGSSAFCAPLRHHVEYCLALKEKNSSREADIEALPHSEERNVDVRCTIQTLTSLLLGYQSAGWLRPIGRLQCAAGTAQWIESLIPRRTTYLLDDF